MIYIYGEGNTEGNLTKRNLFGGKGVVLHDMCSIGVPVPSGFTTINEIFGQNICSHLFEDFEWELRKNNMGKSEVLIYK